jgi:hypothetical protein
MLSRWIQNLGHVTGPSWNFREWSELSSQSSVYNTNLMCVYEASTTKTTFQFVQIGLKRSRIATTIFMVEICMRLHRLHISYVSGTVRKMLNRIRYCMVQPHMLILVYMCELKSRGIAQFQSVPGLRCYTHRCFSNHAAATCFFAVDNGTCAKAFLATATWEDAFRLHGDCMASLRPCLYEVVTDYVPVKLFLDLDMVSSVVFTIHWTEVITVGWQRIWAHMERTWVTTQITMGPGRSRRSRTRHHSHGCTIDPCCDPRVCYSPRRHGPSPIWGAWWAQWWVIFVDHDGHVLHMA